MSDDFEILVDFGNDSGAGYRGAVKGLQPVANLAERGEEVIEWSRNALDGAMGTIRGMAKKTVATIEQMKISERPNKVEVSFGITLKAEAGALLTKAGADAEITVTLVWDKT